MARKKKIINNLTITDIVPEGKGLGRKDDLVVFVKDVVPGDEVDVLIKRNKTAYKEGIAINFHKYSDLRVSAKCKHFDLCGGCKWQNITYDQQLAFKQKITQDAFDRIAKVPVGESFPIMGSDETYFYRNKLEYTFSTHRWLTKEEMENGRPESAAGLGFHLPGMFDRILDIDECLLQSELSNKIRNEVRKYAIEQKLEFYNIRSHQGFLRNLIVRNSVSTGEYMVILVLGHEEEQKRVEMLNFMVEKFPEISSLHYIINEKLNDSYADLDAILHYGTDFITEKMGDLQFRIGPKSFFQTNSNQAKRLYDLALEFADLQGTETIYDLYTGTGTIALYASQKAKKVIGIEVIKEAIDDAKKNAELNNIFHAEFFVGDMKDTLTEEFITEHGKPDVVLIDPPRAGVHADSLEVIKAANPEKIVYISCNPGTQARDVNILSDKYDVLKICPVDMFPHTFHVENVALLKRKTLE
ncbi:MAG: 23S rRNA (uracil(1939)-C(5))-methyltransferase RlmD [Bacteroidales bacterium]|nr:23S rRNA (uracil(1939)-C(5))-methyltransferase RlmD [Bacteroidales bacterium]